MAAGQRHNADTAQHSGSLQGVWQREMSKLFGLSAYAPNALEYFPLLSSSGLSLSFEKQKKTMLRVFLYNSVSRLDAD